MITRDHPEWPEFRLSLEEMIDTLRGELESPMLSHEQTAAIRGEIGAYRRLIEKVEPGRGVIPPRTYT